MPNFSELVLKNKIKYLTKIYRKWLEKGEEILDIGCGDGIVIDEIARCFSLTVVGCDVDKYLFRKITYVHMKKENKLPFKKNGFTTALFTDVLHHTEKDLHRQLIAEALRVVRNKVIIFEAKPEIVNYVLDYIVNKIYHPSMRSPLTFRHINEWMELFHTFPVDVEAIDLPPHFPSPFTHYAFCLTKKKDEK